MTFAPREVETAPDTAAAKGHHYRTLVDLAPDVIYSIDVSGNFTDLSRAFEGVTGWAITDWIGKPFVELVHPDDLHLAQAKFAQSLAGEPTEPHELRICAQRGGYLIAEVRSIPRIVDGRVVEVVGVGRDITQRRQMELDVQQWRRQLEAILETVDDGISLQDRSGRVVYANAAAARLSGYGSVEAFLSAEPEEALERFDILTPDGHPLTPADLPGRRALNGERPPQLTVRFRVRETGEERWSVIKATPIFDEEGQAGFAVNVFQDITDRRRVEDAVQARVRQQAAVAALGQRALGGDPIDTIFRSAVDLTARALEVEFVAVVEAPDEGSARMLASEGWSDDLPDGAELPAEPDTQIGYTLATEKPTVVQDLDTETRFKGARMLRVRGIHGGVSVPIHGETRPWGVLAVHTTRPREFTGNDIHFLESVANVVAEALEREGTQHALQHLAAIVNSSEDAIIGKDLDAIIQSWNPAAEHLYGYTAAEAVGSSIRILVPPEKPHEVDEIMAQIRQGRPLDHYETTRVRKDGRRLDVSVSISPIRDSSGVIVGAATIARNITEQKQAEAERARLLREERRARARLAFLAEASEILARSLDYETTLTSVANLAVPSLADWCFIDLLEEDGTLNRVALKPPDPSMLDWIREIESRYPLDLSNPNSPLHTGLSQLVADVTDEMLVRAARDGGHLEALRSLQLRSVMIVPLVARERILGMITLVSSSPDRRFDEQDLALAEDLARRAAIAVDNARLYQGAQEALDLRDEFLSMASHELKTPLTSLQLQVQILERFASQQTLAELSPERTISILDGARRQMRRLTRLIDDLLDVSRTAAGRLELDIQETDLADIAQDVVERFAEQARASGSTVTLHATPAPGRWDRFRIDQVVTNLLSNAVKYGEGGPIEVEVERDGAVVRLIVKDQGIGIAPEHLLSVFDRFERVKLPRSYGGLGLGLYIAKQIVEVHGGSIVVSSEPGMGSRFVVELPRGGGE